MEKNTLTRNIYNHTRAFLFCKIKNLTFYTTLMVMWNNETGRNMAINPVYADVIDVCLFAVAKEKGLLILDARDVYEFLGVMDYVNQDDWTVDILWNENDSTATFIKEGLDNLTIRIGA